MTIDFPLISAADGSMHGPAVPLHNALMEAGSGIMCYFRVHAIELCSHLIPSQGTAD